MFSPHTLIGSPVREASELDREVRRFRLHRDVHSRRHWRDRLRRVVRVLALLALDLGATAAAMAGVGVVERGAPAADWSYFLPLAFVLAAATQALVDGYGPNIQRRHYLRAFLIGPVTAALLGLVGHFYPEFGLPEGDLLVFGLLAGAGYAGVRLLLDLVIRAIYRAGIGRRATLFIGRLEDVWKLAEQFERSRERRVRVIGHLSPEPRDPTALGDIDQLSEVIERHQVRSVIISAHLEPEALEDVIYECFARGVLVSIVPRTLSELPCRVTGLDVLGWPLVELEVPRLHLLQTVLKRSFDLAASLGGLVLLSPVLALVAAAVKLDSPGPVFFRQERLGVEGRRFRIFKFRTMRQDAEEVLRSDAALYRRYVENDFKLPPGEDPRVTRVGRLLRRTSLDELPQLFNVLAGHMSLVGPRPIVPEEIRHYGDSAAVFLGVKPGLTGRWQVNGRSDVGYPERAELDLEYIKNWSLGTDLSILLRTVPAVFRRRGAH